MKWHKPEFCTEPGPSGPEGIKTRSRILRAGNFAEGCRGIPRKRGFGGGPAGAVRRPQDTPGGVLVPFSPRKKELAQRAKPCEAARRVVAPYGRHGLRRAGGSGIRPYGGSGKIQQNWGAGGSGDPPLQCFRQITAGRENGRGKPLPYGTEGKHSPAGNRRAATWGRPYGVPGGSPK